MQRPHGDAGHIPEVMNQVPGDERRRRRPLTCKPDLFHIKATEEGKGRSKLTNMMGFGRSRRVRQSDERSQTLRNVDRLQGPERHGIHPEMLTRSTASSREVGIQRRHRAERMMRRTDEPGREGDRPHPMTFPLVLGQERRAGGEGHRGQTRSKLGKLRGP